MKTRCRVLLSAYACEPERGSEPGVGWNWSLAYRDVAEIWVLTRENNRGVIEAWENMHGATGIHWVWVDAGPRVLRIKKRLGPLGVRIYYWLWQWLAAGRAAALEKSDGPFDWAHHVTMNGYREPGRLDRLDAPLVWGPIGGLQNADLRLARLRDGQAALQEGLRSVANVLTMYFSRRAIRAARHRALVLGANRDAMRWIRLWRPEKPSLQLLECGVWCNELCRDNQQPRGMNVLWVGSDASIKDPEFALLAWQRLRDRGHAVDLCMVGMSSGRQRSLRRWASVRGIALDGLTMMEWVERRKLPDFYRNAGQFWFTSYRDTSGNVLLEALSHGTPCIAFNHQGAAAILGEGRGQLVGGRSVEDRLRKWCEAAALILSHAHLPDATVPWDRSPQIDWRLKPKLVMEAMQAAPHARSRNIR